MVTTGEETAPISIPIGEALAQVNNFAEVHESSMESGAPAQEQVGYQKIDKR